MYVCMRGYVYHPCPISTQQLCIPWPSTFDMRPPRWSLRSRTCIRASPGGLPLSRIYIQHILFWSTVYVYGRMYECMYGAEYSYSTYTDGRNSYSVISLMLTYPLAAKTTSMARPKSAGTNKKYEKWPNQAKYMATFSPKYSLTKHYKRI